MITETELYWILKLDDIQTALVGLSFICALPSLLFCFISTVSYVEGFNARIGPLLFSYSSLLIFSSLFFVAALIPDTKQYVALKVIPELTTQDNVEKIKEESELIYKLLKEYLVEITKGDKR